MSRKSNRNRKISAELVGAESAIETVRQIEEVQPAETIETAKDENHSRISLYYTKLKAHWLIALVIGGLSLGAFGSSLKYLEDDARRQTALHDQKGRNLKNESLLNRINPFLSAPSPTPTPQLSKEYIYAGSRLLAVEDANASAAPPADLAIWRPSTGVWWVMGGQGSQQVTQQWGTNGDKPLPGDYDGDGKTDFCVYRIVPGQKSQWWILFSSTSTYTMIPYGAEADETVPADYNGDGRTDLAIYRPSLLNWYISTDLGVTLYGFPFGSQPGDIHIPGDYDGDGKADAAFWRNSNKTFYALPTTTWTLTSATFTQSSTKPVGADYDGDGKADYAIRETGTANWIIKQSSNGQMVTVSWQQAGDIEVQNDYDGDGKVDIAVWRPSNGNWYIRQSSLIGQPGELRQVQWGQTGDFPVPAFYRR